jgi:hypothetical protein
MVSLGHDGSDIVAQFGINSVRRLENNGRLNKRALPAIYSRVSCSKSAASTLAGQDGVENQSSTNASASSGVQLVKSSHLLQEEILGVGARLSQPGRRIETGTLCDGCFRTIYY